MPQADSAHDPMLQAAQYNQVRRLLAAPVQKERVWPALCAAAFAASAALALATAMILAPPVVTEHVVEQAP